MKGLKCTTCNCEYNCGCHCNAGIVNIGRRGVCETKQKRELGMLQQAKVNMEAAKDFEYKDNTDVLIQCTCLECCYNKGTRCTSRYVDVADGVVKTKCMTKNTHQ